MKLQVLITLLHLAYCIFGSISIGTSLKYSLGFDFGTSGVRCCCIDEDTKVLHEASVRWTEFGTLFQGQNMEDQWIKGLNYLLAGLPSQLRSKVGAICCSGTSSTVLLYDVKHHRVTRAPRMYNFNIELSCTQKVVSTVNSALSQFCPPGSPARSPTSTLSKLIAWHVEHPLTAAERVVHQADYILDALIRDPSLSSGDASSLVFSSDWHNALKLGYDPAREGYPPWLMTLLASVLGSTQRAESLLPAQVYQPGATVARIGSHIVALHGLPSACRVVAGTTDSIAAFIAAGINEEGQAVTSLGSTLVIKQLSPAPVEDTTRGIYSHRLGDLWLIGGASNTGCAVLRHEGFTNADLVRLSSRIDPRVDSGFDYYPLMSSGERFPVNDPFKPPVLFPKPTVTHFPGISPESVDTEWRVQYLHRMLEGISRIEKAGYDALRSLGAPPLSEVHTCGGGAVNDAWTVIRQRLLGVPVRRANSVEASYGCALLANRAIRGASLFLH
jgi:sugar (pentulose or hexulose) kinase